MIRNIQFEDIDGYLTSTIDGQTLPLPLKKIIRKEVYIENIAFTSVALYEKIPINLIFTTEDELPVDKGEINISIISVDENNKKIKEYYNLDTVFKANQYTDDVDIDIPLGIYHVIVSYKGSKYYQPTSLTYLLTIEPRKVLYDFELNEYYGNPSEVIDIKFKIYDSITKQSLSNFIVYYEYEDSTYITKSDIGGYVKIQATIPEPSTPCINNDNRTYTLETYVDNEAYYPSNATIYLHNNKLPTHINFLSEIDENTVNLHGIVTADNYNDVVNARNGHLILTIDDDEYSDFNLSLENNGNFEFSINMQDIEDNYSNPVPYKVKKYTNDIDIYMTISDVSDVGVNQKITPIAEIKDKYGQKVIYGMISFELMRDDTILENKISEVSSNGTASADFYLSKKGNYVIRCKYHSMFEYKYDDVCVANFKVE